MKTDKNVKKHSSHRRLYHPFRRILTAVLPMIVISLISGLIVSVVTVSIPSHLIFIGSYILYLASQVLFLRLYLTDLPLPRQYITTNIIAYFVLVVIGLGTLIASILALGVDDGSIIYTWLFMPLKLFYYYGIFSKFFSAVAVGFVSMLVAQIVPFVMYPDYKDFLYYRGED